VTTSHDDGTDTELPKNDLVRCQVFVCQEMWPASWVEPWPPDWWDLELDGEPDEGESRAYCIPVELAERANAARNEFKAVGKLIEAWITGTSR
jgi:hypothetical protein